MTDTIFALATAPGRSAVAVVRVSGPATLSTVKALCGSAPSPRLAALRTLRHEGVALDEALVLRFEGPASYTGEDSAEFHVHGGRAVVESLLSALSDLGLRLAEPGEFTRRAFENGKLDLAQAEGVADLIDAETEAQRRQALGQLGGALSQRYDRWRDLLVQSQAMLEAAVDFPDEDLPEAVAERARPALRTLKAELDLALADVARGRRVRDGFRIALIGAPNAGKSTLLNGLTEREAAIVTDTPGTTRDVIEVPLVLGGYKVLLADTAGIRDTSDAIEAEGVRRARAWAEDADLRLWVVDGFHVKHRVELEDAVRPGDWLVLNKVDIAQTLTLDEAERWARGEGLEVVRLSARSASALDDLRSRLAAAVADALSGADFPAATCLRHAERLREAQSYLARALSDAGLEVELAAEDVRLAARALEKITGRVDPEDVLGRVFSTFCIGK
ncbi:MULTISPECIES: tRNA uridine-5-carboxymethylaminomethyl(34) synthesis GTPase MnmE [Caulobacter]|jgi:tRNA modification GTPase|uniref:tRNA modification GTPase MnmE n=1 Tax=Caulobacter vibrioides OR37 TaxID=1292034 RepID=R0EKI3_CAUVI|nr:MULTISPECIES: tRNA uridine-5-carboxymethylaminomethyl(34) synthesis GTPase MnmE [Caulobacter]ENZ82459.1 tRNA modification GTPase trmE [Caulobacter vibrioides OR37]MBQ1560080.1 tRNA uridine-5-carboxymethylaminomethyl(34) synthesis GTPase MnmE [Caulobacter sp.]